MPVKGLTQAEIDAATRAQVASGAKSTDRANRLPGETATEANARITAGYKEMTAKPILSKEQKDAGMTVQFVRTQAGGVGEYVPIKPANYTGPTEVKTFTAGVIPANVKYTTGASVGVNPTPAPAPTPAATPKKFTPAELQDIIRRLTKGEKLTPEEAAAVGVSEPSSIKSPSTPITPTPVPPVPPAATTGKTPEQIAAYDNAKSLAESFVSSYGGKLSDYFDVTTGKVTSPTKEAISAALSPKPPVVPPVVPPVTPPVITPTSTIVPGSGAVSTTGTTRTAFDAFKNTLALFFGPTEIGKPWVNELYKTVSGFTKSGSSPEEAFNMALLESEKNPAMTDFTKRFKGIFALQKLKQEGRAIEVPTIAEYFKTQETMGNLLKSSNLGELANEDYLGDVIGKAVSATEFSNRLVSVFDRIDNASDINKKTISRFFPTLDRTQLAKALLTGEKGAKQLQQELAGYEVLAGAEQQGLGVSPTLLSGITNERAQQIARGGGTYASTLGQFGQIARARETEQKLAEISGVKSLGVGGLTDAIIGKSAKELKALEDLTIQEEARFMGKAGTAGSRALASQSRANRII